MRQSSINLTRSVETWLLWLLVTGIGWPAAVVTTFVFAGFASTGLPGNPILVIALATGGAMIGTVQWLFLNPGVRGLPLWALASGVGWPLGLTVTAFIARAADYTLGWAIGAAVGGLVFGYLQSLALLPEGRQRAQLTLMMPAGWSAGLGLGISLSRTGGSGAIVQRIVELAVYGGVGWAIICVLSLVTWLTFPHTHPQVRR